jgi:FixJ family two-component response regulator
MHPVAYSSAEAFLGDTTQPLFDCLVLDVHLGGMSGIELGRRLRAGGSQTPLIYLTAHDDPDTRLEAEALGCAGFFSKADAGSLLLHTIHRLAGVSP